MSAAATQVRRRVALFALVVVTATGCGSSRGPADAVMENLERMRAEARTLVADPQRRAALELSIDGLQSDLLMMRETFRTTLEELRAVNARPEATRAELEQVMDDMDVRRGAARDRVVQRHFDLTALTFAAEWQALAKHERKALQAAATR